MLASPGGGKPLVMPLGIFQRHRDSHLGSCCTTRAEPNCSTAGSGPPLHGTAPCRALAAPACPTGLHTLPTARVAARDSRKGVGPRRSVAIPVSHIWASNKVANATGTKPFSSNPIITLLFPTIAIPCGTHSAMQNEFMVSIFIPQNTCSSITYTLLK